MQRVRTLQFVFALDVLLAVNETTWSAPAELVDGYRGIWYMNQPTGGEYRYKYSGGFARVAVANAHDN